jgi:sRNA-binding carbon storage regulator CsrA
MPLQIRSKEEAENLIEKATEIRVVKGKGDSVKLKMRTPKALYTFVTTADEASAMTKGLKTPILDF